MTSLFNTTFPLYLRERYLLPCLPRAQAGPRLKIKQEPAAKKETKYRATS